MTKRDEAWKAWQRSHEGGFTGTAAQLVAGAGNFMWSAAMAEAVRVCEEVAADTQDNGSGLLIRSVAREIKRRIEGLK